jgi:hypothetical protein
MRGVFAGVQLAIMRARTRRGFSRKLDHPAADIAVVAGVHLNLKFGSLFLAEAFVATEMGRLAGRATPSLQDRPSRQSNETGRRSTYLLPIAVQTIRATSPPSSITACRIAGALPNENIRGVLFFTI